MPLKDRDMLPGRLTSITAMSELLDAEQAELDVLKKTANDTLAQTRIKTATRLLPRYERIYEAYSPQGASIEERRLAVIIKKLMRYPITKKRMEEIVQRITGSDNYIIEHFQEYSFEIIFTQPPRNKSLMKNTVQMLKPSHLGYIVKTILNYEADVKLSIGMAVFGGVRYEFDVRLPLAKSHSVEASLYSAASVDQARTYEMNVAFSALSNQNVNVDFYMGTTSNHAKFYEIEVS